MLEIQRGINHAIIPQEPKRELIVPFQLIEQLYAEGRKLYGIDGGFSAGNYYDQDPTDFALNELKPQFAPLLLHSTEEQYYAYYDDTGTEITTCISTQPQIYLSDDRLTEHLYTKRGSSYALKVAQRINNSSFNRWDSFSENALESHGNLSHEYKLVSPHERKLAMVSASRVDEVVVEEDGIKMPRRWFRELHLDIESQKTTYKDHYILNREAERPQDQKRADISFMISNTHGHRETKVVVGIDMGKYKEGELVFEDPHSNLKIYVIQGHENEVEILKQDPTLSCLFKEHIDGDSVIHSIEHRIRLLQEDWDKPHSIFSENMLTMDPNPLS